MCILSNKTPEHKNLCSVYAISQFYRNNYIIASLIIFYIVISRCLSITQISSFTLVDHFHFENMILFLLLPLLTICRGQIYAPYQVSSDLIIENDHSSMLTFILKKIYIIKSQAMCRLINSLNRAIDYLYR